MNRISYFTAEQPAAADALQRALRSRFPPRLMPSVRHEFHRRGKEAHQQQWSVAK